MTDQNRFQGKAGSFLLTALLLLTACGSMNEAETMSRAREYIQENDVKAATLELKNVLINNADNAEARYLLGKASLQIGDATSAEKELRRALDAGWNEAEVYRLLAEVLFRQGEYRAVLDDIPIKDDYPAEIKAELLGLWASAEQALGRWKDALGTILTADTIDPGASWVLQSKAREQLKEGDMDAAEDVIADALKLHPGNQDLWLMKAGISQQQGDTAAAVNEFQRVIDLDPPNIVTAWGRKAYLAQTRIRLKQNETEKALAALRPVLKHYANDPDANYLRALIAFQQENYDLAEEKLLKVFKVSPDHYASLLLFGNLGYVKGDFQQAAHYLEKATSAMPQNVGAQTLLGRAYLMLGQYNEAEDRLEFAASRSGENAELLALVGVSRLKSGNVAGLKDLERAVDTAPESESIRGELAKAYLTAGETGKAIELLESSLGDTAGSANSTALLILAYLRTGDFDKAIELSGKLAQREPDNPLPHHLEGVAHQGQGDYSASRQSYRKALEINPEYVLSILGEAELDLREGKPEEARKRYETVLELQPGHIGALVSLSFLSASDNRIEESIELLERARKADPKAVDPRLILANLYFLQGNLKEALLAAEEAARIDSQSSKVLRILAKIQLRSNDPDARRTVENLLRKLPDAPDGHFYLAELQVKEGDTEAARKSLQRVLELVPNSVRAKYVLGNLELETGRIEEAGQIAQSLKSMNGGEAAGYLLEGDVLMAQRKVSEALSAFQQAYERAPDSSEAVVRINMAQKMLGKDEAAYKLLNDWLDRHPEDTTVRFTLAVSYLADGQRENAIEQYEIILRDQPENAAVLNDLAWLYDKAGKPGALEMARKAYKLAPDNPAIQDTYGWLLVKTGRAESGLGVLEEAAAKMANNQEVRYHYAVALAETGRTERAREVLAEILGKDEAFQQRADAEKLLKKLGE